MSTIWKYDLSIIGEQKILIPKNSKILSVQVQNGVPCVWVLVDENSDNEEKTFFTYGTGNPILPQKSETTFLGTYQLYDGQLVFHVFYI